MPRKSSKTRTSDVTALTPALAAQPATTVSAPAAIALNIQDAAAYIAVTPFFIEKMIRSGRLPALRMCRQYTILVSDLDAFLDSQPKVNPATFAAPPDDGRRWRKGKREKAVAA